jgi:bud site selection protein 31
MAYRRRLKGKKPPEGWELIEEVIEDFEQQMKEAVNEEHEGKRKAELNWKIHRIHWEKNRFIFDLMYQRKVLSRELFDYLTREKIADGPLIAKWRKPGYELLCSMLSIDKRSHNFGTTSICRVPLRFRSGQQRISPNVQTGCISCASGDGKFGAPIWWNTPMDDEEGEAEEHRATWGQGEAPAPSRKRAAEDDEDELDEDVKRRLTELQRSTATEPKA